MVRATLLLPAPELVLPHEAAPLAAQVQLTLLRLAGSTSLKVAPALTAGPRFHTFSV